LISGTRYTTKLGVTNEGIGKKEVILVDYCNLPICCRYCLSTNYLVKDYIGASGKMDAETAPMENSTSSSQQSSEGGNTVLPPAPPIQLGYNPTIQIEEEDEIMAEMGVRNSSAENLEMQGLRNGAIGGLE
jgi:hypothetical protein